tara:strand:+ start:12218 stop:13705 length:1488 start_codon:yes stop_codon:yes gene_type:complete
MSELMEAGFDAAEVRKLAEQDPNFLAGLAMPEVYEFAWPPLFIVLWAWLMECSHKVRSFDRLALGLPRGFGKTTIIKLWILALILFTERKFILVLAETATKAENIIADVIDMLDEPNIRAVFGDWRVGVEKDTNAVKKFGFRGRNIIIAGLGAEGSVRGLNLKNARPDAIIFDDVQSRENADSQLVAEKLYQWMLGTAMKSKSPKGCLTVFIGNMYPTPYAILKKLKANKFWTKFIVGGILADGTSLWEDLQPVRQLAEEYLSDLESGHPEIFHAEVLNDEDASINNLVDFANLPEFPYSPGDIPAGQFIVIDPATNKENSDAVAMGYFEVHEGKPIALEVRSENLSPKQTIVEAIKICMQRQCSVVAVESVAYQSTLLFWATEVMAEYGISGINFVEIYPGRRNKNARIMDMFKSYSEGEIGCVADQQPLLHNQIRGFNPLKTTNIDDVLDLFTYAPRVIQEFGDLIRVRTLLGELEATQEEAHVYEEWENSSF